MSNQTILTRHLSGRAKHLPIYQILSRGTGPFIVVELQIPWKYAKAIRRGRSVSARTNFLCMVTNKTWTFSPSIDRVNWQRLIRYERCRVIDPAIFAVEQSLVKSSWLGYYVIHLHVARRRI